MNKYVREKRNKSHQAGRARQKERGESQGRARRGAQNRQRYGCDGYELGKRGPAEAARRNQQGYRQTDSRATATERSLIEHPRKLPYWRHLPKPLVKS